MWSKFIWDEWNQLSHLLEESTKERGSDRANGSALFLLSAKTETALHRLLTDYLRDLNRKQSEQLNLRDICYTAATGRAHYPHRIAMVVNDIRDLQSKLMKFAQHGWEETDGNVYYQHTTQSFESKKRVSMWNKYLEPALEKRAC